MIGKTAASLILGAMLGLLQPSLADAASKEEIDAKVQEAIDIFYKQTYDQGTDHRFHFFQQGPDVLPYVRRVEGHAPGALNFRGIKARLAWDCRDYCQ